MALYLTLIYPNLLDRDNDATAQHSYFWLLGNLRIHLHPVGFSNIVPGQDLIAISCQ